MSTHNKVKNKNNKHYTKMKEKVEQSVNVGTLGFSSLAVSLSSYLPPLNMCSYLWPTTRDQITLQAYLVIGNGHQYPLVDLFAEHFHPDEG